MMSCEIEISGQASLAAIGLRCQEWGIWSTVASHVKIKQKVRQYRPLEKLLDCLINILSGGIGIVEINTRVRPDRAVQLGFGRSACAEQSTVSDTLNACTPANVNEMRQALGEILRQHGQSYPHDYTKVCQLLDIDMTGMPAGRQGEAVSKGYFAGSKNRRGRQLGRVLATHYQEILVDRLYPGKRQLDKSLSELVSHAEAVLALTPQQRCRTILRIDAGGGDDADINWVLARDYPLLVKVKNWRRAQKLAQSVKIWYADEQVQGRDVGWVTAPHFYDKPTRQLAIRHRKANGQQSYHVLVFTLTDEMLFALCERSCPISPHSNELLRAAVQAYDRRGGGIETETRGDKQGLGLSHRNLHRFVAQEMLVLLGQLAHNLVIWTRNDLAKVDKRFAAYGIQRTVRDALQISGQVYVDEHGQIQRILLNPHHPFSLAFQRAFALTHVAE